MDLQSDLSMTCDRKNSCDYKMSDSSLNILLLIVDLTRLFNFDNMKPNNLKCTLYFVGLFVKRFFKLNFTSTIILWELY